MKFTSAAISAFLAVLATAVPVAHEHNAHHLDKRAVVTQTVHKVRLFYQKQVVYVDQNGAPFSTGYEVVSVSTMDHSTEEGAAAPTEDVAAAASTEAPAPAPEPTSSSSQAPPPPPPAPETTSEAPAPAPEPTTSEAPAPAPPAETPSPEFDTIAQETSEPPAPAPEPTTSSQAPPPPPPAPETTSEAPAPAPEPTTSEAPAPEPTTSEAPAQEDTAADVPEESAPETPSSDGGSTGSFAGEGTYYDTGLGACGITSVDTDYIVAISHVRFDAVGTANPNNNPLCGKKINAHYQGKTVQVTVVDRCPGCDENSLDFSPSAFADLAHFDLGRIPITWDWAE